MKKGINIIIGLCIQLSMLAATKVTISNPETWKNSELQKYVGQTIEFTTPFYVCNNYYNGLEISPRRIFQPTNQALPKSNEYSTLLSLNSVGSITLNNVSGYHRMGERLHNLVVKVNSQNSVSLVSCEWRGNTRAELEKGYDSVAVNMLGKASVIVCCMNLEYYLVKNLGTGYGPDNYSEHQKQRKKVSNALAKINADLYGFVEIEQGQDALAELAADLTTNTGRTFTYIDDGGSASGSYTKAGFVYCSEVLTPHFGLQENDDAGVAERKKTQAFMEIATGEKFLFSVNHFKAKSGKGYGNDADQGDGQGQFNATRVREAYSVLASYAEDCVFYNDSDILIMGDLNAYAKEDPIMVLQQGGMTDLHRAFHADSSYSYTYHGDAGYLDHALCNSTLYPQVTGMVAYHINSDESDNYTYDKSNDASMFRCSDHDPVIVGLRLNQALSNLDVKINSYEVYFENHTPCIRNAQGGYYYVYRLDGNIVKQAPITTQVQEIDGLSKGLYILNIYGQGKCLKTKLIVR